MRNKDGHNSEFYRHRDYRKKFGITVFDYDQLMKRQDGHCAVCNRPQSEFKRRFAVDHNHQTRKVRGLLCVSCNTMLGQSHDSPEILRKAAGYLEKARESPAQVTLDNGQGA